MGAIRMVTGVPGPKSRAWLERLEASVPRALHPAVPVVVAQARGALLEDMDGNRFLDFAGGLGALNVGHAHPKVTERLRAQAGRFLHTDFSLVPYGSYVELAERLAERAPVRGRRKVAFFNSGAEAVENAVKIARRATGRAGVVAFEGAFHGRTLMALSLTSRVDPYKRGFGPFAPEVYRVPFPDPYRHGPPDRAASAALEALERAFATRVPADEVAAIIVEPVQGEGGFVVPPAAFIRGLRAVADRYGIALIADEIQTGFGRTGRFFALEHFGVEADLVTVGKSIAAGLPLSAVVGSEALMDAVQPGGLGGTTIGNPLACEAGLAVLDVIEEEGLVARAQAIGEALKAGLSAAAAGLPGVGDVRGLGAMVALEWVASPESKEPDAAASAASLHEMLSRGLIAARAGLHGQVIRFLPPLVTRDEEVDEALQVAAVSLSRATQVRPPGAT